MLMADDVWSQQSQLSDDVAYQDDDLTIDLQDFWDIMDEKDPIQNCTEDLSAVNVQQGLPVSERASSVGAEFAEPIIFSCSYNSDALESRIGTSDFSSENFENPFVFDHQNMEPLSQTTSPARCSGSLSNWMFPASGIGAGANSFIHDFPSHGVDYHDQTHHHIPNCVPSFGFAPEDISLGALTEFSDLNHVAHFDSSEHTDRSETADTSLMNICMPTAWDPPAGYSPRFILNNVSGINCTDGREKLSTQTPAIVHGNEVFERDAELGGTTMGARLTVDSNISGLNVKCEDHISASSIERPKPMLQFLPRTFGDMCRNKSVVSTLPEKKKMVSVKNESGGYLALKGIKNSCNDRSDKKSRVRQLFPPVLFSKSGKDFSVRAKNENEDVTFISEKARQSFNRIMKSVHRNPNQVVEDHCTDVKILEHPYSQPFASLKKLHCKKDEIVEEMIKPQSTEGHFSKVRSQTTRTTSIVNSFRVDDDPDVCILEDRSGPARSNLPSVNRKPLASSQHLTISDPLNHVGLGGVKLKENDERLVLRVALQDLSQPKTEASPPDGVLAVPLLRHQRIALSWMVQKETASLHCSGGILADDQGLGKTISTIALILKERSPTSSVSTENYKQNERKTYNLDEDDDCASVLGGSEQDPESCQESSNGSFMSHSPAVQAKGRPRAGTLVVCPTSVLRQWADELHNKVTQKGKLSVLVYHGSSRTKDPSELASYDVVLTTYSIVSMEVPKQPLDDKDEDEIGRNDSHTIPSIGLSSCKKRKYPPTSKKSSKKVCKEIQNLLLEPDARPLARVGWFRVVLDEAQSIKNHRTQVARACWGLRAKRRWCLSGTPIQNSVEDLYSYFRFLRYDPYATYKSFCASIKVPISRKSTTGYKKLQAVLKTVMLRRTKATLLDGEPIINLPPKTVELKKVDFTMEERDFYCRLEADSRAQFEEYAAAGTVKQNYVNILLMLLRLRQACDHPLLVRGYDTSSAWRSSVEMAKKLSREKQVSLLGCLEASLAICGLCNDPPEDAVVTSCGHVFCNQCICEHLMGDDKQCPATNCKDRLSASSVFSRDSLKCSLSQEPGQDITHNGSGSEVFNKLESSSWDPPFVSSKIKTALKVLESLSKSKPSTDYVATLPNKSPDPFAMECELDADIDDDRDTELVEASKEFVKVAGEKAIVFSQWTRMLDLLEAGLKSSSIQYRRLDGTMTVLARDKAVKDFKTLPEVTVIIMSLKAASLGLNMVAACHVILLDLWWNPTTEDQAVDRAHRIGQTRPVSVLRLTVKDTVEDRILALQQKKREMVASAFGEDETGSNQTRLTVEDLKYLFMA